jgi:hypothetical protein
MLAGVKVVLIVENRDDARDEITFGLSYAGHLVGYDKSPIPNIFYYGFCNEIF